MHRALCSLAIVLSALTVMWGGVTRVAAQAAPASQRILVLVPAGDARLARSIGGAARDHATTALTAQGFVAARGPAGCTDPDCAAELLSSGTADLALAVALWGRTRCERVAVTLVDAHGVAHGGEVEVSGTDVNAAIDGAIAAALAHLASGGSSVLSVTGAPPGATITLDQTPWGTLPHEDRVPHGEHQLAVSADGYTTERRTVVVGSEPVAVSIELARAAVVEAPPTEEPAEGEAAQGEAAHTSPASDDSAVFLLAGGGVLTGLGVIGLGVGIVGLALPDSGTPMPPDFTYERTSVEASIAWMVAGGVSLAAGVVLLLVGATSSSPARASSARPALVTF
ncbi:MAG: PEGA domain-containing protein [Sandaracinaceae bacterium]|nr:PEGA domain-containing protein [Sandaracinaceae bacterium]